VLDPLQVELGQLALESMQLGLLFEISRKAAG